VRRLAPGGNFDRQPVLQDQRAQKIVDFLPLTGFPGQ
jgi:hypothetical protein